MITEIDDQPIEATFFREGRWLTDFITPDALGVQALFQDLTKGIADTKGRILACWQWVASKIRYVPSVHGWTQIGDKVSVQKDLWLDPTSTIQVGQGNCAVKSFLLTSLLRNELAEDQCYCVLGNLHNGKDGGHAWVKVTLDNEDLYMESTMPTAPPLIPVSVASRYEAVHFFNDQKVFAVEGKTQLVPFTLCYSTWLEDYLHWSFIESQKR
jgi:hypothetical protein